MLGQMSCWSAVVGDQVQEELEKDGAAMGFQGILDRIVPMKAYRILLFQAIGRFLRYIPSLQKLPESASGGEFVWSDGEGVGRVYEFP